MKHTTQTVLRKSAPALAIIVVVGFLISLISAQEEEITVGSGVPSSTWEAFVTLCATIAPYCGVLCFLAPIPTIGQVKRDKTTGALPLLPYSSMVCPINAFTFKKIQDTNSILIYPIVQMS